MIRKLWIGITMVMFIMVVVELIQVVNEDILELSEKVVLVQGDDDIDNKEGDVDNDIGDIEIEEEIEKNKRVKLIREELEAVNTQIGELKETQELAHTLANSARELGLVEDSEPIIIAKQLWEESEEEKAVLYKEVEGLKEKYEEKREEVRNVIQTIKREEALLGDIAKIIEDSRYAGEFRLTGYCPCSSCSEGYGTQTASGNTAYEGITIAADLSVLSMGTKVYIEGLGIREVQDIGGGVKGNHIDVYVEEHEECYSRNINDTVGVWIIEDTVLA